MWLGGDWARQEEEKRKKNAIICNVLSLTFVGFFSIFVCFLLLARYLCLTHGFCLHYSSPLGDFSQKNPTREGGAGPDEHSRRFRRIAAFYSHATGVISSLASLGKV